MDQISGATCSFFPSLKDFEINLKMNVGNNKTPQIGM